MKKTDTIVPQEYYHRYLEISTAYENSQMPEPQGVLKTMITQLMSLSFFVPMLLLVAASIPLIKENSAAYYSVLVFNFIIALFIAFIRYTLKIPRSHCDVLAQEINYKSSSSELKFFDLKMTRDIAKLNNFVLPKYNLIFEDMYCMIFDKPNLRTIPEIFKKPKLSLVK